MKKIHYLLLALVCGLFASCMDGNDGLFNDGWKTPESLSNDLYGNPSIKETNLVTIAQLKNKFSTEVSTEGQYKQITEPMQIKAVVTANDIQGNMYNEIAVQDETGAIFIGIAQGGVFGYLPEGTEILVELNGLYIGNYRKSPTIGTPYNKDGDISVSRMPRALWLEHFTYTGQKKTITPEVFSTSWNINTDAGKLCTIKNVTIKKGGYYNTDTKQYVDPYEFVKGESAYSHPDYSTSWYFNELPDGQTGGVQLYTSNYADFAAMKLPTSKMNLTGVIKRYRDQWELILRTIDDVEIINE